MSSLINETHSPELQSWASSDSPSAADFPIQNLPFGRFSTAAEIQPRIGVAIGDWILDLSSVARAGLLSAGAESAVRACSSGWLNGLMALTPRAISKLRAEISRLLAVGNPTSETVRYCLVERCTSTLHLPVDVRNYSDFFTSANHAENVAKIKRPDGRLPPNFHSLPGAYHGRASTVLQGGTPIRRPRGQWLAADLRVTFAPTEALDFECELGTFLGQPNDLGGSISLDRAPEHVFGFCLLNDWSARDIQSWEAIPLGPFLGKSFATTISPWVVTLEALAPFRIAAATRWPDAAPILDYLNEAEDRVRGGLDVQFEVSIETAKMRQEGLPPMVLTRPKFKDQYWTVFQSLTHHASNGCAMLSGDLLGSGTVSGRDKDELGCLLELTRGGKDSFALPTGENRGYLEDGDALTISARCVREDYITIGFGQCSGTIASASLQ